MTHQLTKKQRKEKKWLIATLLDHMWEPEWFSNYQTHGCYDQGDFVEDLRPLSIDELKALRRYQEENLDADLFYEHVWNGEFIEYRSFE